MSSEGGGLPALEAVAVAKEYVGGDGTPLRVLNGAAMRLAPGEAVAIIGESGSGKSTLLHILGGLDRPTEGEVRVQGQSLAALSDEALSRFRTRNIGFVFQFHHLLREFTALENVMMPQRIAGVPEREARSRARELLADVGLDARASHRPGQLSGGEQQRVAVARALANQPAVVLADEPSGNLDPSTSGALHDLLFRVSERHATAMVLVTHNLNLAARADRVLEVRGAELVPVRTGAVGHEPGPGGVADDGDRSDSMIA